MNLSQNTPVLPNMRRMVMTPSGASCSRRNSAKLSLATIRNPAKESAPEDRRLHRQSEWPPACWSSRRRLFRKAFHIVGDDDLRRIGLTYALQVFHATSQLGSRLLQAAFECRLGRLASLFVRELLKHDRREKPPFGLVAGSGRAH